MAVEAQTPDRPVKRGRGRPRLSADQVAERRREIVVAAFEVFLAKGYHASGTGDVARHLGVGHGTIYLHFKNKRELADAVVDYVAERAFVPMGELAATPPATAAEFREWLRQVGRKVFAGALDQDPRLMRLALVVVPSIDEELVGKVGRVLDLVEQMLCGIIQDAADRGFVPPGLDAAAVAKMVVSAYTAACLNIGRPPLTADERERFIETGVAMICGLP